MARNRILYFDLLLFCFALFVLLEDRLFHLLLLVFLLLPIGSMLLVLPLRYTVQIQLIESEDLVGKGDYVLPVVLTNRSLLPCACVRASFSCENMLGYDKDGRRDAESHLLQVSLRPKQRLQLAPSLELQSCGHTVLSLERAWVYDPLGLIRLPVVQRGEKPHTDIYVLPETVRRSLETEKTADLGRDSDVYSKQKPGGDPAELFQLRDYRPGDARHSIHWKLSGRLDRLIVREFGLPLSPSVCFLVSLLPGVEPIEAEAAIATQLAFSEHLLAKAVPHRIGWIGTEGALRMQDISDMDGLALALHELLALPAVRQGETLLQFLSQQSAEPELHLLMISAGPVQQSTEEDRVLLAAVEQGICRRLTMLQEPLGAKRAEHLRQLGCEAYRLDGRRPDVEEVF